jgi:hypothetical protein
MASMAGAIALAPALLVLAALVAMTGLYFYKYAYVRAGQLPPLS